METDDREFLTDGKVVREAETASLLWYGESCTVSRRDRRGDIGLGDDVVLWLAKICDNWFVSLMKGFTVRRGVLTTRIFVERVGRIIEG